MSIADQIKHHMALAFFGSAYADQAEECGQPLSGEIMDQLPEEIDPAAIHAAETLIMGLEQKNGSGIEPLFYDRQYLWTCEGEEGGREFTPEMFGHYLAMQAMGHGVGLWDAFGKAVYDSIKVPSVEFGSYSLQKDYFTAQEE